MNNNNNNNNKTGNNNDSGNQILKIFQQQKKLYKKLQSDHNEYISSQETGQGNNTTNQYGIGEGKKTQDELLVGSKVKQQPIEPCEKILISQPEVIKYLKLKKKKENKASELDINFGLDGESIAMKGKDVIYKPAPVGFNQNMGHNLQMDPFGINRNMKDKHKYYSVRREIDYFQMSKVTSQMETKYQHFELDNKYYNLGDIPYQEMPKNEYLGQTLKYLLLKFIVEFNATVKRLDVDIKYYQFTPYKIINMTLIKVLHNKKLNLYKYILVLELYRNNKRNSIIFYLEFMYKTDKDIYLIWKMMLMGVRGDDQIAFNKLANRHNNNQVPIHKLSKEHEDEFKLIRNEDEINEQLQEKTNNYNLEYYLSQYKCYNPNAPNGIDIFSQTENDCLSYSHQYGCTGKWDIPCARDEECPFYQANKNYKNKRGGCKNQYCELPVGMKPVGHHYYDHRKPLCYNCKKLGKNKKCKGIECNQCCDEQKNKKLYPHMRTPDFVFADDLIPRTNQKDTLERHKLTPTKLF